MMKAWATFAKDPKEGLTKVMGWPTYDPERPTLISLGGKNSSKIEFVGREVNDAACKTHKLHMRK
jgi:cholinesterase